MADSYTDGVADRSSVFSVSADSRVVSVAGAFVQASAPNGIDWRQDSFSVFVAGIQTPRSTAPTLSFKARIVVVRLNERNEPTGYVGYKKEQGVYSNVFQARDFRNINIRRTSLANGDDSGLYIFTLQFSTVVFANEYLKITPPASVSVAPAPE